MDRPLPTQTLALCVLAWLGAVVLPLALWPHRLAFVGDTYGRSYQPFELLGLTLTAVVALVVAPRLGGMRRLGEVGLPALAVVQVVNQVAEYSQPSWDWSCYQAAAAAVLEGADPYAGCYVYPPLPAQVLARLAPLVDGLQGALGMGLDADATWKLVFYVFQASQPLAAALVVLLLLRLAARLGMDPLLGAALVALLVVVDVPVQRTLRHDQVNLWVLGFWLLAWDLASRRPAAAGLALALAAHVKLYPLALLLPWLLQRRWSAIGAAALGTAVLALAVTGRHPEVWSAFFHRAGGWAWGEHFRDNSVYALVINTARVPARLAGADPSPWLGTLRLLGTLASLAAGAWLAARLPRRREDPEVQTALSFALVLLVSPMVWEHHYVFALPLVLVAAARSRRPGLVAAGAVLALAVPTFDLFPLSAHRLLGLLLLLRALAA